MIWAHRGVCRPGDTENTLSAFAHCKRKEMPAELDVRLSADGVPVVFHDASLQRMCGQNVRISAMTAAELKAFPLNPEGDTVPTLEEVLTLVNGTVPLMIETKAVSRSPLHPLEMAMLPLLNSYPGAFMLQSFSASSVRFLHLLLPDIPCGILCDRRRREPRFFDFINYRLRDLTPAKTAALHQKYPQVCAWGTPEDLRLKCIVQGGVPAKAQTMRLAQRLIDTGIIDHIVL